MIKTKLWNTDVSQQAACIALFLFSWIWGAISIFNNWQVLFAAYAILCFTTAFCVLKLRSKKDRPTVILEEITFFIFIIFFCIFIDIPNENSPRVTHIFFLVLAAYSYITYLRWKSFLRLVVIAACLCAFVVFSSITFYSPHSYPVPDEVRHVWAFSNVLLETFLLCGGVYVIQSELISNRRMARDLRAAVKNGELELYFQPQVDESGKLVGAEALLRWNRPRDGLVSPTVFIPVAEESGLMPLIGSWVLKEACRTLMKWSEDSNLKHLTLAVNVSPAQFNEDSFLTTVQSISSFHHIDPTKLKMELTESVVISDLDTVISKMNNLSSQGYTFALDDFGTGYSSLSHLRNLPLSQLKIDRSFVQASLDSAKGASIVKNIVKLGRDLDLAVLAEGIETEQQLTFMRECGCKAFQGYLFGRPMPAKEFMLQTHKMAMQIN